MSPEQYAWCWADTRARIRRYRASGPAADVRGELPEWVWLEDWEVRCWPQAWADTSCGRGGAGGQMITTAHCVVFWSTLTQIALVYQAGAPILVARPDGAFWDAVRAERLPGAGEHAAWRALSRDPDRCQLYSTLDTLLLEAEVRDA